ncbi:MAG: DUF1549 domain-containing protein, partial [Candidatus Saccharimonas sp.]|nr:DUF1549 domain-containing protein [Planctomycetaceae bacterium]
MSNQTLIAELMPLLEALCEDRLTREETARLERLVLGSAEARWFYLSYVDLHGSLYWDAAGVGSATALSSDEVPVWTEVARVPAVAAATGVASPRKQSQRGRLVAVVSVAACVCVGVIGWFVTNGPANTNQIAVTPTDSHRAVQTTNGAPVKDLGSPSVPRHRGQAVEIASTNQTPSTAVVPEPEKPLVTVVPAPPEPQREELDSHQVVAAINTEIRRGWEIAEVQPSAVADDAEWLRRVSLDLSGRIPTVGEAESFLANTRPGKREQLIDQLLDDTAYARNFTTIWTNLLVGRRSEQRVDRGALRKFLRMSFAANRP